MTFTDALRRVVGCVTDRPLLATGHDPDRPHYASLLPLDEPAPLRLGASLRSVALTVRVDYAIVPAADGFAARIRRHSYRILERDGREILAYHRHPGGASPVNHPHVHLSGRSQPFEAKPGGAVVDLAAMHLATGQVGIVDIVRMLIEEFGVEPRRPDWQAILAAAASEGRVSG